MSAYILKLIPCLTGTQWKDFKVEISRSTRGKVCKTILDILKPCDILGGQTEKQKIAVIQMTTDQCLCYHD